MLKSKLELKSIYSRYICVPVTIQVLDDFMLNDQMKNKEIPHFRINSKHQASKS